MTIINFEAQDFWFGTHESLDICNFERKKVWTYGLLNADSLDMNAQNINFGAQEFSFGTHKSLKLHTSGGECGEKIFFAW